MNGTSAKPLLVAAAVVLTALPAHARAADTKRPPATQPTTQPAKVMITVGKATTYITGPLNADGTVNYVAYINAKARKGVTPQNNAAVALARAFGPAFWDDEEPRAASCRALGIKPPPPKGDYFMRFYDYLETLDREPDAPYPDEDAAAEGPWRAKDHPLTAAWLKANARPLEMIVAASKRPRCYRPIFSKSDPAHLLTVRMSFLPPFDSMDCLITRAMLKLGSGKAMDAWDDAMAAMRLSRHDLFGPDGRWRGAALHFEGRILQACAWIITSGKLTTEQLHSCRKELDALRPGPPLAETLLFERFSILDDMTTIARGFVADGEWDEVIAATNARLKAAGLEPKARPISWDQMMRMGNRWCDRIHTAALLGGRNQRNGRLRKALDDMAAMQGKIFDEPLQDREARITAMAKKGESIPALEQMLNKTFGALLTDYLRLSPRETVLKCYDSTGARSRVVRVAIALALYEAKTGTFPAKLADLAPRYVKALPKDLFTGKALLYSRQGKGCVVYSIGKNLRDDGGTDVNAEDVEEEEDLKDDIAVRFKR